jgi:dephospho-CoA kinase
MSNYENAECKMQNAQSAFLHFAFCILHCWICGMPLKRVYLIGLTGNIACGKSTVLAVLEQLGARVIDADRVTHDLQQPGEPVYDAIVAEFGAGILAAPGGPLDRRALGAIVFADPAALRRLEQIVHPAVHARIEAWLGEISRQGDKETRRQGEQEASHSSLSPGLPVSLSVPVAVIDAIKLLESGWKPLCDAIWVVTCTPEQQVARLIATRGLSEAEARARIAAQPPQADKVAQADVVIDNRGPLEETRRQVEAAWRRIGEASAAEK